jgi:hypothetical protein
MNEQKIYRCTVNSPTFDGKGWPDPIVYPSRPCCKDWQDRDTGATLDRIIAICTGNNKTNTVPKLVCGGCLFCHEEE